VQFSRLNLVVNSALAALKAFIGVVAASRALMASALYSVNDVLSAVIVIISLRVARRPPDSEHAYGYGKAEFIAIGIVSTILAGAVIFILFFSVADLFKGVEAPPHYFALFVAALTMATNAFIARRGFCVAERLGSPVLETCAEHNHADAVSSLAAMIGIGGAAIGLHFLDPLVAIFETFHIIWLSGSLLGHSLRGLMDGALPPDEVEHIARACQQLPGVLGLKTMRTRQSGPHACVDMDVLVSPELSVKEADRIRAQVAQAIRLILDRPVETQVKFCTQVREVREELSSAWVSDHG
jgi:cation diffusion facilitator family transporter